jgi:acetylornithine deacetylase
VEPGTPRATLERGEPGAALERGAPLERGDPRGVLALLQELVAIPSVSGDEGAIADFVMALLSQERIDAQRLGHSVLARLARGSGPRLMLLSHLDTVPVGEGWTHAPFAARWENGRLYGRGANDAKASAAAMLATVLELARRPRDLAGEVWLALNAQEETDNSGMRAVLATAGMPDGAVCGEPTGLEVVRAQAGLAILRAEWRGRSCHAAHVAKAEHVNALLAAAAELARFPRWLTPGAPHALLGPSTITPTVFQAGKRHNVVPDRAELVLDCRLAPPHTAADARRAVAERLSAAEVTVVSERLTPFETAEDHPLVRAALTCAGRERALGSLTLSDMALLGGTPAVKCGPGETARSHTSDEFVLARELEAGVQFYARFVPAALDALRGATR